MGKREYREVRVGGGWCKVREEKGWKGTYFVSS